MPMLNSEQGCNSANNNHSTCVLTFFFNAWNQMHPTLAKGKHFRSSDAFTQMKEGNVQKSQKLKIDQFTELNSGWELMN